VKRERHTRSQLRSFLGNRPGLSAALIVSSVASGLLEAAVLALVAQIATALVHGATRVAADVGPLNVDAAIGTLLTAALCAALLRLLLAVLIAYLPARISADVQARLSDSLFGAYTEASWPVQAAERDGHLQDLMTTQILQATYGVLYAAMFLSAACTFVALLISALVLSVSVALVVVVAAGALFLLLRPLNRLGQRYSHGLSRAGLDYAGGITEAVSLAEETQVFGAGAAQRRRVKALIEHSRSLFFRTQFVSRLVQGGYQGLVIVLLVGGLATLYWSGAGRIAILGAVVLMLVRSAAYGQVAQTSYHQVQQAGPYLDRLRAAEDRYLSSAPPAGHLPLPTIASIAFDEVTFSYRTGFPVVSAVTFEVTAGEAIGIVGPSGAGKSTLLQLLLRLREPTSGRYLIHGELASEISRVRWQRFVAYVPQEPRLLQASVADNIRFLRNIDDDRVERAARLAHIHDDIVALPEGYETVVGQRADAVSGGQRQRICLARALAGEPEILVLDEPTSALDTLSESLVQQSLVDLHGHLTLFIVAHRLSMLAVCDRLMVIVDGRLEAFGPTDEVERNSAFYRSTAAGPAGTEALRA